MSRVHPHLRKTFDYYGGYFLVWLIAIAGVVVTVSAVWITTGVQAEISNRIRDSLKTVLTTTKEGLRIWAEDTKSDVTAVAGIPEVRDAIVDQLRLKADQRRQSKPLAALRRSIKG